MSRQPSSVLAERKRKYARWIWGAMVNDEPPSTRELWLQGYEDAAEAVICLADEESATVVAEAEKLRLALAMAADDAGRFTPEQYIEMAQRKLALLG